MLDDFDLFNRWHRRIWWAVLFIPGMTLLVLINVYIFSSKPSLIALLITQCLGGLSGIAIGLSFAPQVLWILNRIFEPEWFERLRDD